MLLNIDNIIDLGLDMANVTFPSTSLDVEKACENAYYLDLMFQEGELDATEWHFVQLAEIEDFLWWLLEQMTNPE